MVAIQGLTAGDLPVAAGTPGISRHLAFESNEVLVLYASVEPGIASGWHHHDHFDVYGYVVSGAVRFECGPGGQDSVSFSAGDFFHVPALLVHRDVNPSDTEGQKTVLFLHGSGQMVVNVDGPEPD